MANEDRMTKARSEHGEFRFRVKEFGDGTTYLAAEPERSAMTLLDEAQMFFQLRSKMNIAQAQRVADYLNEHISSVGITLFENHPMFNATPKKWWYEHDGCCCETTEASHSPDV
jgi:hypothetical protein